LIRYLPVEPHLIRDARLSEVLHSSEELRRTVFFIWRITIPVVQIENLRTKYCQGAIYISSIPEST